MPGCPGGKVPKGSPCRLASREGIPRSGESEEGAEERGSGRHCKLSVGDTGLEEAQAGIQIAGSNINNFRYADDTTLVAESKEELKSLLMKVKEESEKVGLKLNI